MDLPWNDERSNKFITNVGLITSDGPFGADVMACEWTHHISYSPGLIAVCISPNKATYENIKQTKEFGVNLCSTEQSIMSSIAGGYTGSMYNKINASNVPRAINMKTKINTITMVVGILIPIFIVRIYHALVK